MGQYQNKSELYLESAEILDDKSMYAAVPHCAYYSCMLLVQHIWYDVMMKTESDLKSECSNRKTGSHEVLINEVVKFMKNSFKDKRGEPNTFNNKILQLKRIRVEADYRDNMIDIRKSQNSIQLSKEILPILKEIKK